MSLNYVGVNSPSSNLGEAKSETPMERAIKRVEKQFKTVNDEIDRLSAKLSCVSSDKPAVPISECSKQPELRAPLVDFVNNTADRIASIQGRIIQILERLDI